MPANGLDHVNIDTSCPEETVAFYTEVLGLEDRPGARPDFGFPGAWLWAGTTAVVHLNFHEAGAEPARSGPTGAFNHIAFEASDFDAMCATLTEHGLDYKTAERPEINLKQIFVNDPNGIRVELNIRY